MLVALVSPPNVVETVMRRVVEMATYVEAYKLEVFLGLAAVAFVLLTMGRLYRRALVGKARVEQATSGKEQ